MPEATQLTTQAHCITILTAAAHIGKHKNKLCIIRCFITFALSIEMDITY